MAAVAAAHLPAGQKHICPVPTRPGEMTCMAIGVTGSVSPNFSARPGLSAPYTPRALRAAYGVTRAARRRGRGETIAIVDAFRDPNAAKDLGTYRKQFGMRPCTRRNHCLRIVNQNGRSTHLPKASAEWAEEESLDLDMVSAICPRCKILLVETRNTFTNNLGAGVARAVRMGARFVSNSWSGADFRGESRYNHLFNHRGHVIDFAAGDFGYGSHSHRFPFGVAYPTSLPYVTAVGGTTLTNTRSQGRNWRETVWGTQASTTGGTNSGCTNKSRPSWQRPVTRKRHGCRARVENDVSAVGNPNTGVVIRDTFRPPSGPPGWLQVGGTSAATPIITGIYALAGRPRSHDYPVTYAYRHRGQFYDVRVGTNGSCPRARWICHAERGFDGPTGLGTPRGWKALSK